jgi:hydrogenase/urease accessory protein HupE
MAETVYLLCALTSSVCAFLLFRGFRSTRARLLFWSSLCFVGLALGNILLFVDVALVPGADLSLWRSVASLGGILVLLFGFVWEST